MRVFWTKKRHSKSIKLIKNTTHPKISGENNKKKPYTVNNLNICIISPSLVLIFKKLHINDMK